MNIMTVGNSFANDATRLLPQLAAAGGKPLTLLRANLGGASLERHANHLRAFEADPDDPDGRPYRDLADPRTGRVRDFSLPEALQALDWDVVTIQQVSHLSFKPDTFEPHAEHLIRAIRRHAPKAEILVHQSWAYREDYPGYGLDGLTPQTMHAGLVAAYNQLAAAYALRILPVGEAFRAARATPQWRFVPDTDFDFDHAAPDALPDQTGSLNLGWRWHLDPQGKPVLGLDYKHANTAGQYLGAAVFYEALCGDTAPEVDLTPQGLPPDQAAHLRQIAHKTMSATHRL